MSDHSASDLVDILNPNEMKFRDKLLEATEMGDSAQIKQVLAATSLDITQVVSESGLSLLHLAA